MYFGCRYDEAIPVFQELLKLDPVYPRQRYTMGMCLFMSGDTEAALEEVSKEPLDWMRQSGRAILLHNLGRLDEARKYLDKMLIFNDKYYALYQLGQIQAQSGQVDEALEYLKKALDFGDPGLSQLLVDPLLDPIRNDPRFVQMLQDLKFN